MESERAERRARLEAATHTHSDITRTALYNAVPCVAEGVQVQRKPVVAEAEFEWGYVLTTAGHPEGTPCSSLIAKMVSLIDGRISVSDLLARLRGDGDEIQGAHIERNAIAALQILYVDGTVADLHGL